MTKSRPVVFLVALLAHPTAARAETPGLFGSAFGFRKLVQPLKFEGHAHDRH